ncbi:redoxin family protein [Pedobacter sp.]|uniref:redoxin family protein n=1 Tax=Pedobacter sp. TaxID=1411316 RepID=UPI003D7FBD9B
MKFLTKTLVVFACAASSAISVNGQQAGKYKITGDIQGLSDAKIYLSTWIKGKEVKDSVLSKQGHFEFNGTAPGTLLYSVGLAKQKYVNLFVQPSEKITLKGSLDNLKQIEIKGAAENPVWQEWGTAWSGLTARAGVLYKKSDSLGKDGDRTEVTKGFDKLNQDLIETVEAFVKKYPSSAVMPFIITDRFVNYPNPEKAASTYAALSDKAKNSLYGKELGASLLISAKTKIGVKPSFTLPDVNGKAISLASLKGKVVLVDFWASWCGPCRKENPNLVKAYEKYKSKGFEIIGVSLDNKKNAWESAIKADQLAWLHVSDLKGWNSELAAEYGIKSIPTSFLVDAEGTIIAKDLRGEDLEKKLATLFK